MSKLFAEPYLFITFNRFDVAKTTIKEILSDKDTLEEVLLDQLAQEWGLSFDEVEEEYSGSFTFEKDRCGLDTEEVSYLISSGWTVGH